VALLNHAIKEITAKLIYYGPGLCGKTTNLQWIHEHVAFRAMGSLLSLATETDRTIFFDFLPVELGVIRGMKTRVQIYTVPGQVFYDSTRRMVLKGADAVVFVADSQARMLDANLESLENLQQNLIANGLDPALPMVLQYNKRDLPTALPVPVLNARLNPRGLPFQEAVAVNGTGVEETLQTVLKLLFKSLSDFYEEAPPGARAAAPASTATPPPIPPRVAAPRSTATPPPIPPRAAARPSVAAPPPIPPRVAAPPPAATPPPIPPRPTVPPPPVPRAAATPTAKPQEPLEVLSDILEPIEKPAAAPPVVPSSAAAPVTRGRASVTPPGRAVEPPSRWRSTVPAAVEPDSPPVPPELKPPGVKLGPDEWLYLRGGKQHGPLPFDDLVDLVLTSIPEETMVWGRGTSQWTPANVVPEITEHIPPPLPLVGTAREEDFPDFNTVPEMLRTALIADEDASFRQRLALPLAAQGFQIYEASDGSEAWRLATEHRPWLMLADLGMPEVDGFEFCRRVRANSLLSHTPLVFISGSDRYKDRYRAMQLGADDFLSKQTPIRELLIRIQLLLTRYSDLGAAVGKRVGAAGGAVAGALEGQIEVFGAPGVLQICNQGRLTGIFTARAQEDSGESAKVAVFGFRDGEIITATVQELTGPEAVYAFLAWNRGQFKFVPGDPGTGAPLAQSVEHLILEGCRLLDESRQRAAKPGE
jgi:CheY-like chemotaxis protein/signal recognition particle receptor subunit beta